MKNPAFTRKEDRSLSLDKLYFYNLIKNPQALPPEGLDAVSAELIRRLVNAEQNFRVKTQYQLEPARERVWQNIMGETGLRATWPPVTPPGESETTFEGAQESYHEIQNEPFAWNRQPYTYPQPAPSKSFFEWSQLFIKAGMVVTVVIVGLILLGMVVNNTGTDSALPLPVKPGAGKVIPPEPSISKETPNPSPKTDSIKPGPSINLKELLNQAVQDLAGSLKIDQADLQQKMKTGLSLSDLAISLNTDPNVIRQTLIASIKRQLNEGVTAGKWTATQAEQANKETPNFIDQVLNNKS